MAQAGSWRAAGADFFTQVALGRVPWARRVFFSGNNPDIDPGTEPEDVHAAGACEAGPLRGQITRGHVAVGHQPLGQAGIQAARYRVFGDADRCGEGPHFQIGRSARMAGIGSRDSDLVPQILELQMIGRKLEHGLRVVQQ